jgi:type I restriction-modification system DNA methylase subunit
MTKELAKESVQKLIDRFKEHHEDYHSPEYNEAKTRQDFINPFFKALGWDVDNERGDSESYREVIYEDKVVVRGKVKAPDYGFRLQGSGKKRLFYVEAKKPSVKLKLNKEAAYQLRRYGNSAQASISILTNFEDFLVYDCTKGPNANDSASVARLKHIHFEEYITEFDFIYNTFSHEAVTKGRFDKFVQSDTYKKGTETLDKRFVKSLDGWRKYLAVSIATNNKKLGDEQINFAVQQTIDRLIFLRFCEDRAVEPYGQLQKSVTKGDAYKNLVTLFQQADDKYNSGLFDFEKDDITPRLKIENKVVKTIVEDLYYPQCTFEFSVMPVEILGNAYEQFLGKVIRLTPARSVKIEEKPEVRKAGGVYYTPQYIVEYIVKNTVGKLIEGKSPAEISAIKIVDPACGSGSFLLGAFEFLLNYHINWYHQHNYANKKGKDNPFTPQGTLTTHEKKRILTNSIFGVDIDANAVEVTKLSLLLKCMEGETEASIHHQMAMFHERVLPDLDHNIKDGNSLIDTDFYDSQIDFGYEKKIKPFSWKKSFPEVFKQGGFDAVIGNPPYVRQELLLDFKEYFESHYKVYHGVADLYSYFFERGIQLLNEKGLFGIIVANKWMRANYGEPLRKWLKAQALYQIIDFGDLPVFQSATTYPCIVIAGKANAKNKDFVFVNISSLEFTDLQSYLQPQIAKAVKDSLDDSGWNLASESEQRLLIKLQKAGVPLREYVNGKIYYGIKTGLNEAFVIDDDTRKLLIKEDKKSAELIKPFLAGRDVKRYQKLEERNYLILIPTGFTNLLAKSLTNPWKKFKEKYPAIGKHLTQFESKAKARYDQGDYWWELRPCDYYGEFEKPKIIVPAIVKSASYAFDENKFYSNDKTCIIPTTDKFLLGVINSKACDYYMKSIASTKQGGYFEYKPMYVERLPIPKTSSDTKAKIVKLVDDILQLNQELQSATLSAKVNQLQSRITHSEEKIDALVYELYQLIAEEIKIVEGKSDE